MESGKEVVRRRRYSREMKEAVLAQCEQPGASVARVAMEHGINANVVHSWRKRTRGGPMAHHGGVQEQFVPLALPATMAHSIGHVVEVEVQHGATLLKVRWPLEGAADLALWTREVLR
jgi:transposase